MYWNSTMPAGGGRFAVEKIRFSVSRVKHLMPDILCLDEFSSNIKDVAVAQAWADKYFLGAGAGALDYKACAVVLNAGTHLNTVVFCKASAKVIVTGEVIPAKEWDTDRTKRNLVRVKYTDQVTTRQVGVWFLHANASTFGGKTAVELVAQHVRVYNNDVIVGDFNNPNPTAPRNLSIAVPIFGGLKYSQWTVTKSSIDGAQIGDSMYVKSGGLLDYALLNASKTIVATAVDSLDGLTNGLNDANSVPYLQKTFDHFPITYDLTCP